MKENSSLRERKIKALRERQNQLKGFNGRVPGGVIHNVEEISRTAMGIEPRKLFGIAERSVEPVRKRKIEDMRKSSSQLKKSPPKKLNKRMLFY